MTDIGMQKDERRVMRKGKEANVPIFNIESKKCL